MNIKTYIENKYTIIEVDSTSTLKDIQEFFISHIDLFKNSHLLWDLNELNFEDISHDDLDEYISNIQLASEKRIGFKSAFLNNKDTAEATLRVFTSLAKGRLTSYFQLFKNKNEAINWLVTN